jgi:DNA-binding CsgD family transcriptional regulator
MFDERIMPIRTWRGTEIYNDFLLPLGLPYFVAYWLHKSAERVVAFSLQATQQHGPFDAHHDVLLRPLMPHLKRALDIRDRLAIQQVRAHSLSDCLDRLQCGVFVLDDCARIVDANAVAEELLRTETVLRRERDRTLWLRGDVGLELQRWVYSGAPTASRGTLLLQRTDGRLPLSVMIAPLPEVVSWTGPQPRWLVMVFDQEARARVSAGVLADTLEITDREAQLVAQLARHCNLAHAAGQMGISLHTARSHLKSIYSKTGVRSQAELLGRALGGLAPYLRADS